MTGYAKPDELEKIAIAPLNLRQTLLQLIDERDRPCAGGPAGDDLGEAELAGRSAS